MNSKNNIDKRQDKKKVILDTDIGYNTDADDALALAYLLLHEDCELLGITTVGLHSPWRAELAEVICNQMGRPDIPVFAGAEQPLCNTPYWHTNPVSRWPEDFKPQPVNVYESHQALQWMRETIRKSPGEITLITIGQFTNLAILLLADPETAGMLKNVFSMGGNFDYPSGCPETECNVVLDPVATAVVFQHIRTPFKLVTIDRVRGKGLGKDMLNEMLQHKKLQAVRACCEVWGELKGLGLADPFTVTMAFEPQLASFKQGRVGVKFSHRKLPDGEPLSENRVTGFTTFEKNAQGPHQVVNTINRESTHKHLLEVFQI